MAEPRIEDLLAHSAWIRGLAGSLARDPGLADDIVQETWISALRRGPRDARSPRGWLATLVRRQLRQARRGEERRARREELHARALAEPSTADVVARAERHRDLVQAVLDLREPFRTTVLLRYLEECTPDEIARRMDVLVPTVHSRLARGLAALRLRLAPEEREERWALVLAWLRVGRPRVLARELPLAFGVVAAWSALALLLVVAALWSLRTREAGAESQAPMPDSVRVAGPESEPLLRPQSGREAVASVSAGSTVALPRGTPSGLVLDTDGQAVAGVTLGWNAPDGRAVSGSDGRFALPAGDEPCRIETRDERFETVYEALYDPQRASAWSLVVAAPTSLTGRLRASDGRPIAGASLRLGVDLSLPVLFEQVLDSSRPRTWHATSGPDGRFEFARVALLPKAMLEVRADGFVERTFSLTLPAGGELALGLARPEGAALVRGLVRTPDGRPAGGAWVAAAPARTRCDAEGRFELVLWPTPARAGLVAALPGVGLAELALAAREDGHVAWPEWIELELAAPRELAGQVLGRDGRALAGAPVWLADPSRLGSDEHGNLQAEALMQDEGARQWQRVLSDAEGRFVLGGLLAREYRLRAADPTTLALVETSAAPGASPCLDLRSAAAPQVAAGRLVDENGQPLAGVCVWLERVVFEAEVEGEPRTQGLLSPLTTTDARGHFTLPPGVCAGVLLRTAGPAILPASFAAEEVLATSEPTLVLSRRAHLRVELVGPAERADQFEALDGDGRVRELVLLREGCSHRFPRAWLTHGRSLLFVAPPTVRTLVFYRETREVGRTAVELEAGRETLVRW